MAHVAKYSKGALGHLFKHYERAKGEDGNYVNFGNEAIDTSKSHLNYNLAPTRDMTQGEFVKQRCSEVKCLNRKDVNLMCSWVVTAPKDLPIEKQKEFFEQSYKFLSNRYGEENVISAHVHNDETSPHMHYAFVPVVYDAKKQEHKVSAKLKVSKIDLQSFHKDLEAHMEQYFGYSVGIINEATKEGNKSIQELKQDTAKAELEGINRNIELAKSVKSSYDEDINAIRMSLKAIESEYEAVKDIYSSIEEINHIEVKEGFLGGKVTVKKDDFNKVINLAKQSVHTKEKIQKLILENRELRNSIEHYRRDHDSSKNTVSKATEQNKRLKNALDNLKEQGEAMYAVLDKHGLVPEAKQYMEAKRVADKVLNKNRAWDNER